MTTFVFPGQGSQSIGMGADLFAKFPTLTENADDILGYSIEKLCLEEPERLNQTQYTQPAIYVVNALTYFNQTATNQNQLDFVAGHSLGEYNALLAAGVFDFEAGLILVKERGRLMSQAKQGKMIAVIGETIDTIRTLLQEYALNNVFIANHNSHTQIVLSGETTEIDTAKAILDQKSNIFTIPLKVSGAFHSPLMQSAQDAFQTFLKPFTFASPRIPVISNVTARPYQSSELPSNLIQQITQTVRWADSINHLLSLQQTDFQEIGPGTVLTGLTKQIKNSQ